MNKMYVNFNSLKDNACNYLKEELSFSSNSVIKYDTIWRKVRSYMLLKNYTKYSSKVGEEFIKNIKKNNLKGRLSEYERAITRLNQFNEEGVISAKRITKKPKLIFDGEIGHIMKEFILSLKLCNLNVKTVYQYSRFLYMLNEFCKKEKVTNPEEICYPFLLVFFNQFDKSYSTNVTALNRTIRRFTKFLYDENLISYDVSKKIPFVKNIRQPKLPSIYSRDEISKLLKSIDTSTVIGKRNYAMIIIAVRLGLRASDIANLKLQSIKWEKNSIRINQIKTGKLLTLPLIPEVGNAIIDYLKYGRPKCNSPYIFIKNNPPYKDKMTSGALSQVVKTALSKAGIKKGIRAQGPHALRHSLANRILEENTPIYVLQEVLGHHDIVSTKFYIRIDVKSMRICPLEVSPVSDEFYEQNGGLFYG